jgi:hypothetical protein
VMRRTATVQPLHQKSAERRDLPARVGKSRRRLSARGKAGREFRQRRGDRAAHTRQLRDRRCYCASLRVLVSTPQGDKRASTENRERPIGSLRIPPELCSEWCRAILSWSNWPVSAGAGRVFARGRG